MSIKHIHVKGQTTYSMLLMSIMISCIDAVACGSGPCNYTSVASTMVWHSSAVLALHHQAFLSAAQCLQAVACGPQHGAHFLGDTCGLCKVHERVYAGWGDTS